MSSTTIVTRFSLVLLATAALFVLTNPASAVPSNPERRCPAHQPPVWKQLAFGLQPAIAPMVCKRSLIEHLSNIAKRGFLFGFPDFACGVCPSCGTCGHSAPKQYAPEYVAPPVVDQPQTIQLNNANSVYVQIPQSASASTPSPIEPESPIKPETPIEPESPTKPETPIEPESPTKSETAVEPETPETSDIPTPQPSQSEIETTTEQPTSPPETQILTQTETVRITETATIIQPAGQNTVVATPPPQVVVVNPALQMGAIMPTPVAVTPASRIDACPVAPVNVHPCDAAVPIAAYETMETVMCKPQAKAILVHIN
ncbi:hypothetical protein BC936DRAFT_143302 [Jimgerdemannia flammicorona]|uniref:Uncharacterized protein n=1 Tax=Jimgerdemannia flammicorona TaxID=994334 RepID=A0A433DE04_9FUNG|nr:hypothetical protein BC936DRAFT_143302 [Jimgerdemannia flammicorona]